MSELLTKTYYGNTIENWLIALSIIVLSMVLAKVIYWIFGKFIRIFTSKTKNKLDSIIVDTVEEPAVFMVVVVGIWFGLNYLILPEGLDKFIAHSYQVIFALLVGWMLSRLFDAIYQEYLLPFANKTENDLDDQLMPIIKKGVKLIIWSMAVVIGLNNAGYDVGALIAGLGIGGIALAMAAKDTISNVFGGFTIFADQPFRLRERIKINGIDGTVVEIGVRSTRLQTLEGRIVTIPNASFTDAPVENVSREPSRKIMLDLGLTYDTTPENMQKAMNILKDINNKNLATENEIITSFNGFGDFALNILFVYYIKKGEDNFQVQSDMNLEILKQFNEAKLDFAFPTQTLYQIPSQG